MADGFGDKTDLEEQRRGQESLSWKEYRKLRKKNAERERSRKEVNEEGCTTL